MASSCKSQTCKNISARLFRVGNETFNDNTLNLLKVREGFDKWDSREADKPVFGLECRVVLADLWQCHIPLRMKLDKQTQRS